MTATDQGSGEDRSLARIRWRCRRGKLENDLVLARFLDAAGGAPAAADIAMLDQLLHLSDEALWDVIAGRTEVDDPALAPLVARLRAA